MSIMWPEATHTSISAALEKLGGAKTCQYIAGIDNDKMVAILEIGKWANKRMQPTP